MLTASTDTLIFPDTEAVADLGRYAARARSLNDEGAMRLQAHGLVLAAWVGVLPGSGVLRTGTVLGLRTLALAEPAEVDVLVPLGAVTDRTRRADLGATFPVPPTQATAPWTALTPPRQGWSPIAELDARALADVAAAGIAEVAEGAPEGSGRAAVAALRSLVWSRPVPGHDSVGTGLAFAAYALGFLSPQAPAIAYSCGSWVRLSTPAGHALMR